MASLKRKTEVKEKTSAEKSVEVSYPRRVNNEKRPTLVGFFTVATNGYPIFSSASLTEREKDGQDIQNLLFPQYTYEKDGEKKYVQYIHPISAESRKELLGAVYHCFEKVCEDETVASSFDKDNPFKEGNVEITYPRIREVATFPALIGDANFKTTGAMAMHNCELHQKSDGNYFVACPARHVKDENGEWHDYPFFGFASKETAEAVLTAAVEAFKE